MIAKAIKGSEFLGALQYDFDEEKGRLIDSNMAGRAPIELAAEFRDICKLRRSRRNSVLHVSISAAIGEEFTDSQWRAIGRYYLDEMSLDKNQFVVTIHRDKPHQHIHIVANLIRFDGGVTPDSWDYARQEKIMRAIERKFSLSPVRSSKEADRRCLTKRELEYGLLIENPSMRQSLQYLCDWAADRCHSFDSYCEELKAAGISLHLSHRPGQTYPVGLTYQLGNFRIRGSRLGRSYTVHGLSKRGIHYGQNGNVPANGLESQRELSQPDRAGSLGETEVSPVNGCRGADAAVRGSHERQPQAVGRGRPENPSFGGGETGGPDMDVEHRSAFVVRRSDGGRDVDRLRNSSSHGSVGRGIAGTADNRPSRSGGEYCVGQDDGTSHDETPRDDADDSQAQHADTSAAAALGSEMSESFDQQLASSLLTDEPENEAASERPQAPATYAPPTQGLEGFRKDGHSADEQEGESNNFGF